MADHGTARFTGPETQEAFLADRQRFWAGFTTTTVWATAAVVLLLIGMGVCLL